MTGLFFSLKVTSAYMIFGKSSGVPADLPCVRQSQDEMLLQLPCSLIMYNKGPVDKVARRSFLW